MREVQVARGLTALAAAGQNVVADLSPWDRVTGLAAAVRIRLSVPAAAAGDAFADIFVGGNIVAKNYAVPCEEFAGAGPNLRAPATVVRGGRGDKIMIVYRNADAANATTVTHHVEVMNVER